MSGWNAGAATISFPIEPGTSMAGYMARTGPAIGIHDGLTITALMLNDGASRLAIVTADLASVDSELVEEIARASGLDRSELIVCASHTHSGPAGVIARMHPADDDRLNPAMRADFTARCAQAIATARARMESVDLVFGSFETRGLAANRNEADGPFDPMLSVIAARRPDGAAAAALVHFACHPTVLGADNRAVSADFPGALRRSLIARGIAPVVLFANGAAGDVSTRFTRQSQDFAEVERVGSALADAVAGALASAKKIEGSLRHERMCVTLPPRPLAESKPISGNQRVDNLSAPERRKAETRAQGAVMLQRLAAAGPSAIRPEFELEGWRIGDINLVTVPGELFASLGVRIRSASPSPTLVLGYANGYAGYLADRAAFAAGTYEALASPFAPGAGERFAETAQQLVRRLDANDEIGPNRD